MKIRLKYQKKNNVYLIVMMAIAILLYVWNPYPVRIIVLFGALYYLIKSLDIELYPKIPWLWTAILFGTGSFLSVCLMQHIILDNELYPETEKKILFLNVLIAAAIYFTFHFFIRNAGIAAMVAHIFLVSLAFLNNYVYAFRQNEFMFSDLTSMGTGLSVALNYRLYMFKRGEYAILISILFVALVRKLHIRFRRKWRPLVDLGAVIVLFLIVGAKSKALETQTWEQKGSKQNGYLLNYYLSVKDTFIKAPDGYSEEAVSSLEAEYGDETDATTSIGHSDKNPTIIFIMDESFADLSVLGSLQTNEDVMPFIHSMSDNTVKGYALSSVFGAKTPNSEWEFLTGNSMAFLPSGSVVYQQYIKKNPTSLVSDLKNDGYTAVAMHPYFASGWRRSTLYPGFGFDETHFMDDGYFDETKIMREYITDQELFDKMIARFEQKQPDEKLFLMGITMQNHGGYKDYYSNFTNSITQYNSPASYDANQYLSLAHETDNAVRNLINYFQNVDEPVEIVFFGDHQPSLDELFYYRLNGKGMSGLTMDELENFFKVPFFIWTNYETEAKTVDVTSLNFLSTMTLERAGYTDLPAYNEFLKDLNQVIPAMNFRGYYSKTYGQFIHYEDAPAEEKEWLEKYEILQYNNMFDKRHKSKVFFPYLTGQ